MRSGPHQVTMLVSTGMPVFEAALPSEIFGIDRSDLVSPWYSFSAASTDGSASVQLSSGFRVSTVCDKASVERADTVIVPACASVHERPPSDLVDAVRQAYERASTHACIWSEPTTVHTLRARSPAGS